MLTTQEIDALLNASREADEGPTMLVRRVEAAVEAAERERWKEAAMALRELERYEYAAATIGLRKAVASMGPNADGIKRWVSNDQPCDTANESDLWRCTVCGRTGTVGRCCGEDTREPVQAPNVGGEA